MEIKGGSQQTVLSVHLIGYMSCYKVLGTVSVVLSSAQGQLNHRCSIKEFFFFFKWVKVVYRQGNKPLIPQIKILNSYYRSIIFGKTVRITVTQTIDKGKVKENIVIRKNYRERIKSK